MLESIKTKICNGCQIEKSVEEFSKDKTKKDGLQNKCKECNKAYNQANAEKILVYYKAYHKANTEKYAEYQKAYYQANADKILVNQKAYNQANAEKISVNHKAYCQTNREAIAEQKRAYRQANAEKYAEYHKTYRQTTIGKAAKKNSDHKRRSITKQGDVTTQQLLELQNKAKVCYWCNKSLNGKKIHIDHYVPLSKGGEHTLSNLVVSCSRCNLMKNAKDPLKFAQSVGKLF